MRAIYIAGIIALGYGIFHCAVFPDGEFVRFFGDKSLTMMIILIVHWVIWMGVCILVSNEISRRKIAKEEAKAAFDNAIKIKETVKVFSKTFETSEVSENSYIGENTYATNTYHINAHYIAFEFPDKNRKAFRVGGAEYCVIAENDVGILTYKEYSGALYFLDFQII